MSLTSTRRGRNLVAVSVLTAVLATPVVGAAAASGSATSAPDVARVAGISPESGDKVATPGDRDGQRESAGTAGVALIEAAPVAVSGVASDGTEFVGRFVPKRFEEGRNGRFLVVGRLVGQLGDEFVSRGRTGLPVTGASNEAPAMTQGGPVPTPGACEILTLNLGPLDLNILGLRVALDEVNLLIEAIPGAGNLLGNLLCAVAGLLDPGLPPGLGGLIEALLAALADLLNGLLIA